MRKSLYLLSCSIILIFSFIFNPSLKCQMPGAEPVPGMESMPGEDFGMGDGAMTVGSVPGLPGIQGPPVVPPLPASTMPAAVEEMSAPPDIPSAVAGEAMSTQPIAASQETMPGVPASTAPAGSETVVFPEEKIGTQGNWVKKREWLKEAQKINLQVQEFAVTIQKSRKTFTDKFFGIDNDLDTFYKQEGLRRGKLENVFESLEKYLDKKKKKIEADLKAKNEAGVTTEYQIKLDLVEDELAADKKDLEQLKLDMKSIEDLDKSVALRLKTLDEQIKIASDESAKAQDLFNDIWYMIDDKKARAGYYELNGNIFERVKTIKNYIENDLTRDFDNVLGVIRTQISKVKESIKGLESKGLIIKNRAKRIRDLKLKELDPTILGLEAGASVQEAKKPEKKTWYTNLYDSIVDYVARSYVKIKKFFGLEKETVKKFFDLKKEDITQTTSQVPAPGAQPSMQMVTPPAMGMQPPPVMGMAPSPMMPLPGGMPLQTGMEAVPGMEGYGETGIQPVDSGMEMPGGM